MTDKTSTKRSKGQTLIYTQKTTQKTKDEQHEPHQKSGEKSGAPEW